MDEPCVYKKCERNVVIFLILYVGDILLNENDVGALFVINIWLANYFDMKDLGESSYILGIKLLQDHRNKILGWSQAAYIVKILVKFVMHNSKKGPLPFRHRVPLSKEQCPKTIEEEQRMKTISYASAIGSLMDVVFCTRQDIYYVVSMVSRY